MRLITVFFALLLLLSGPCLAGSQQLSDCAWLVGYWSGDGDAGLEESWTSAAGNTMMGLSRVVNQDVTVHREFQLIEQEENGLRLTLILVDAKGNNQTLHLRCVESGPKRLVFAGRGDEITYTLTAPGRLSIEVHKQDGQVLKFQYHKLDIQM